MTRRTSDGAGNADGVADAQLIHAQGRELLRDGHHGSLADLALVRTSERGADIGAGPPSELARAADHGPKCFDRLRDRHVDVGTSERLRGRREDGCRPGAAGLGAGHAPLVRNQDRIPDPRPLFEPRHQLVRIGQLWNGPRRHEAGGLDLAQSCIGQLRDEAQLGCRGDRRRLVLQPVPWAHLVDADVVVNHARHGRARSRRGDRRAGPAGPPRR